jgi:hypothetical protein
VRIWPTPRALAGWAALLTAVIALGRATAVPALDAIAPNPNIQRAIAAVASATDEQELTGPLVILAAMGGDDFRELVPQLLYFSMRGSDVREGMAAAVIIDRLHVSKDQQLRALAPYLDTRDAALQRELSNWLSNCDRASASQPPDFTAFAPLLREHANGPPLVLGAYMLRTAPDRALAALAEVYIADPQARQALLAEGGARASAALERLAEHDAWWVRLYVAERVKQDPTLQTPALMQRLREDPHPAVRAVVGSQTS